MTRAEAVKAWGKNLRALRTRERRARDLVIVNECSALVKQFFRQAPGVAADFQKLWNKYAEETP